MPRRGRYGFTRPRPELRGGATGCGPRCGCGAPMVPHESTIADELGPELGALVQRIVDTAPPPDGNVFLSPDGSELRWWDRSGNERRVNVLAVQAQAERQRRAG